MEASRWAEMGTTTSGLPEATGSAGFIDGPKLIDFQNSVLVVSGPVISIMMVVVLCPTITANAQLPCVTLDIHVAFHPQAFLSRD